MPRTSTEGFAKYGFWLAGYYEDFQGLRCIADDTNTPSADGAYDTNNTHHGNIMNGEATLNPRFRWSIRDRVTNNEFASSDSYLLHNKGISDWTTLDTIRLSLGEKYEGRSRLQYPSGWAHPNRTRYNKAQVASTDDTYMLLGSGHDSSIQYFIPLGDTDATYGRSAKYAFNGHNWHDGDVGFPTTGNDPHFYQTAHLTGCFMGERVQMYGYNSSGVAQSVVNQPEKIWHPVISAGGKPFLNVTTYQKQYNDNRLDNVSPTGADRPVIACSTPLNSRGDGEYFTIRVAHQAYNGYNASPVSGRTDGQDTSLGASLQYILKVGFPSNTAFGTTGSGGGTAAIEWSFDPSGTMGVAAGMDSYHTYFDADQESMPLGISPHAGLFSDFDFKLDYTNNKFKVYHNGTEVTATNTTAGAYSSGYTLKSDTSTSAAFLPKNMTGWELFGTTAAPTASEGAIIHTMIDRAALYIPLTNPADGAKLPPPVTDWACNMTVNSTSLGRITILDDDSEHNLTSFFLDDDVVDWKLLMFSGNIDRPLWQGVIDSVKIQQRGKDNTRAINVTARDSLGVMDRQITSWEVGQVGLGSSDVVLSRKSEVAKLAETMYLGTTKLQEGIESLGFESATSYSELHDQRPSLYNADLIQMYNNEDEFGPNNVEREWLGYSIIGITKNSSQTELVLEPNHGLSNGDTITVYGTSDHDGTYTLKSVNGITTAFTFSITPTRERPVAVATSGPTYVGTSNAKLLQIDDSNPDGVSTTAMNTSWFKFDAHPHRGSSDNKLAVGDYITIPETHSDDGFNSSAEGSWQVTAIQESGGFYWFEVYGGAGINLDTSSSGMTYCIDKGFFTSSALTLKAKNRNIHAVWMRDLAKSRWFRKHFGIYAFEPEAANNTFTLLADVTTTSNKIRVQEEFFDDAGTVSWSATSGVGQIIDSDGFRDTFTYLGVVIDDVGDGHDYLVGVSGLSKDHSAGATIESMKLSDDYKHIWLLWSDMRNNGDANADGGYRKSKFGLLPPHRDNYEVEVKFADQMDENGNRQSYTSLKADADFDLWEMDGTDPSTDAAWSYPLEDRTNPVRQVRSASGYAMKNDSGTLKLYAHATSSLGVSGLAVGDYIYIFNNTTYKGVHKISAISSNDISLETTPSTNVTFDSSDADNPYFLKVVGSSDHASGYDNFANWEDKGGSFVIMDSSKFFNLNTFINGGQSGQEYGTRKSLPDWEMNGFGVPVLMDSYWREATASQKNIASPHQPHQNSRYLYIETAQLNRTIQNGDTVIETKPSVSDIAGFPDTGFGKIKATRGKDSDNPSSETFYYSYTTKLDTGITETCTSTSTSGLGAKIITCSAADFVNDGVVSGGVGPNGMRVRNVTAKWVAPVLIVDGTNIHVDPAKIVQETGSIRTTVAVNDTISVPQQLAGCYIFSDSGNNYTNDEAYELLVQAGTHPTLRTSGSTTPIAVNAETNSSAKGTSGAFDEVVVMSTLSSRYALRFLTSITGHIETPNIGTYWLHDKMRYMWSFCFSNSWLTQASIPCWYDIGSIPNYYQMTTDGTSSNFDSFGSVIDMRGGKSLLGFVKESAESTGYGYTNTKRLPITYFIGKDNKLEIRPAYNCGEGLTRTSFSSNTLNAKMSGHITNVRVYYNGGASFADFPEPTLNQTYRWKILEIPEATSRNEALSLAQEEYNKAKTKSLSIKGKVLRDETFDDKMLSGGRTGYVADVSRWCERGVTARSVMVASGSLPPAPTQYYNYMWSSPQSGSLFPGMVNALDGHLSSAPANGDTLKRDRFGYGFLPHGAGDGDSVPYNEQYHWWGANSISHAAQMVFIPANCPKASQSYGDNLRMYIALKDGQSGTDIDNAEFTIYISDCQFNNAPNPFTAPVGGATVSYAPQFDVAGSSSTSLNVKYSGLYEIDIPSSYWSSGKPSGAKFVISVDCEYLRALLRRRCGSPTGSGILHNAHDIGLSGISNFATTSADSLFPIGVRQYSNMTGAYDTRNFWYAPRIHIVDDLRWRPATNVTMTDSGLGLSSEPMVIQDIRWQVNQRDVESVELKLERDESKDPGGLASYLYPNTTKAIQSTPYATRGGVSTGGSGHKHIILDAPQNPSPNIPTGAYSGGTFGGAVGSTTYTPPLYQGGTTGFNSQGSFSQNISGNNFNLSTHSNLAGRMDLQDMGSEGSGFTLLGQKKPPVPKNTQRGVEGLDALSTPSSSTATTTNEGFVLPGLVDPDVSDRQTHTQSIKVRVPDDVSDEMVSVDALYTMGGTASSIAVLTVEVECVETSQKQSRTFSIAGNKSNTQVTLMGTIPLQGVVTKGNTVKVSIKRTPGSGDDDASYSSVVIHNVKVNFQRFSTKGKSNSAFNLR